MAHPGRAALAAEPVVDLAASDRQTSRSSLSDVLTDAVTQAGAKRNARAKSTLDRGGLAAEPVSGAAQDTRPPSPNTGADGVPMPSGRRTRRAYRFGFVFCAVLLTVSALVNFCLLDRTPPAPSRPGAAAAAVPAPAKPVAPPPVFAHVVDRVTDADARPPHRSAPAPVSAATASAERSGPVLPRPASVTAPAKPAPPPAPHTVAPTLSAAEAGALVSRGDALFGTGDLTAARLFYRRAAEGGDGAAALRLGESFDPAFLRQAGLGPARADPQQALYWYHRARELGDGDADPLLKTFDPARR